MRFGLVHLLATFVACCPCRQAKADQQSPPTERVAILKAQVANAERALRDASEIHRDSSVDTPEIEALRQEYKKTQLAAYQEALQIAKANPASPAGIAALDWLLMTPNAQHLAGFSTVLSLLIEHHAANPEIAQGLSIFSYVRAEMLPEAPIDELSSQLFQAVIDKNADPTARGHAALGLAKMARRASVLASRKDSADAPALAEIAERRFETVIREYGDCKNLGFIGDRVRTPTLRDEAGAELFELRHLRGGQPAPEIVGEDLEGMQVKLSDYRGKVTLLVFWASWCGACMANVPHEKELCTHFEGRPFALVGVNADDARDDARAAVKQHAIRWRSFWNGERGADGPIAVAWNVRGWPTIYVIDHEGVIRHKNVRGDQLDNVLEGLVAAAEAASAPKQ